MIVVEQRQERLVKVSAVLEMSYIIVIERPGPGLPVIALR